MAVGVNDLSGNNFEFQELINNSWDGIGIIDKQTKFVYLNDAFSPMLGYKKEELKGESFLSYVKQDYKGSFLQLLKDNIQNSYNTDMNLVCLRSDEKPIYLKITVSLMHNKKYFVLNAKDITKEISDDEILNNYVLSFHTSKDGIIQEASYAFCKLSGYKLHELINKKFSALGHKEQKQEEFVALLKELEAHKEPTKRFHLEKQSGDSFYVDITMKAIYNKYGDITGYTALMFDVTTELTLDNQLAIENSKLEIMSDTIKTISHEWRQPLNIISLKAQALQFEMEDTNAIQVLEDIKSTSKELSDTIEDFQNIMKQKSRKVDCDIEVLLNESIEIFNRKGESAITFRIVNDINKLFMLNRKEIVSILTALYMNSKDAFVRNFVENREIELKTYTKNNTIHIVIKDNAGGINIEVLPEIFNPYFSTKEKRHGVGLGLYMCKMIIQMHLGGTISASSEDTHTTFHIALPIN